jgi:catechol 2,3-dioxygenase-like lactoylglutathione lyase family enzyme
MTNPKVKHRVEAVGVFLASDDVPRLAAWYRALGVPLGEEGHCFVGGDGSPGSGSVFSVMPAAAALPAAPKGEVTEEPYGQRRVTLNLRVDDLEDVVAGLRARGTRVAGPKDVGYGIFAWAHDPDGNVVEMWEAGTPPG